MVGPKDAHPTALAQAAPRRNLAIEARLAYPRAKGLHLAVEPTPLPGRRSPSPLGSRLLRYGLGLVLSFGVLGGLTLAYERLVPVGLRGQGSQDASVKQESAPSSASRDDHRLGLDASTSGASPGSERCLEVSQRVSLGGSVSPLDADGWAVELWLFAEHADLASQAENSGEFSSSGSGHRRLTAERLAVTQGLDDSVRLTPILASPIGSNAISFRFGAGYTRHYFAPDSQPEFHRLAGRLARATDASAGALFARCSGTELPQLGSWFFARNTGTLVGTLVATMLLYPSPLGSAELAGKAPDQRRAKLRALTRAWRPRDHTLLARASASVSATVTRAPGGTVTLTFPFSDGNRATRLAQTIASGSPP